jgi:redox-sensitive bicupin YhaK (pirin superfamily)
MTVRDIRLVRPSRETLEGAGVHLRRAFGSGDEALFDPFLLLDDFRGDHPSLYEKGFPWHPHRGIETVTYMIEGTCDHGDSMGNQGTIGAGDVQWMTAASGIVHQEMPCGDERGRMGGFQLWTNLPAALKMTEPRYRGVQASQIPLVETRDARVLVIAGRVGEVRGPVTDIAVGPEYLDVTVAPGRTWSHWVSADRTVFAYLFEGEARFSEGGDAVRAGHGTLVLFGVGDQVQASAGPLGARFLLASGRPLREPVAWRGPIVMNYPSELDEAWRELTAGTFVKQQATGVAGKERSIS